MRKRKVWAPKPEKQLALFTPEQIPCTPAKPIPAPLPTSATATAKLPDELVAAGWRIVWNTDRYGDGWFYALNEQLGQRTAEHIYVKHRGYKFAIREISQAQTTPA